MPVVILYLNYSPLNKLDTFVRVSDQKPGAAIFPFTERRKRSAVPLQKGKKMIDKRSSVCRQVTNKKPHFPPKNAL